MEIAEIKRNLTIIEVARHFGIQIGKNQRAKCPFHPDKTPSLQFSREKNICTCFSSNCTAGTMDIIGLTEKYKNINKHEALKYLSELAGEIKPIISEQKQPQASEQVNKTGILKQVFNYFENALLNSKPAKDYCTKRNLNIKKLQIGYNTGTYHHNNKTQIPQLETLGLLKKINSGHSPFGRDCIVFPLKDKTGNITGLYFRETNQSKENKHYYLKDRSGLYPKYPKPETKTLIIPESIIDTATLLQYKEVLSLGEDLGEVELLASYGTNGITAEHKQAILEWSLSPSPNGEGRGEAKEIIIFFDGDEAGRAGAEARAKELKEIINCRISIVNCPDGEDINSLSIGHEPELFTELLNNRQTFLFSIEKTSVEPAKQLVNTFKNKNESEQKEKTTINISEANIKEYQQISKEPNNKQQILNRTSEILNTNNPYKLTYTTQSAIYYIKGGLPKALDSLKITLEIENIATGRKSRTKPDLFEDKQVEKISREAGEKLGIRADLIELDLNYLTDLLDQYREQQLKETETTNKSEKVTIPIEEQQKCINYLKQKNLIQKFNNQIEKAGITGEENNRIFLFVIATSYKMPDTLHALIQGSSGSGKTYLSRQITDLMPKEDVIRLTRVTESSFYNYGEYEIQHKLIALEDIDGLKEEAEYAFRELQSNGEIISSTSTKDEGSGQIKAQIRRVKGPIGSIATTTKGEIYEDNMSRIFLLAVDESKDQTNRIIQYQNQKSAGMINKSEEIQTKYFIQNCIRMLKPYEVINPYANKILLPQEAHKIRRLTELYHAFINQITLLNQYQRKKIKSPSFGGVGEVLITEKEDVQIAIDIMFDSIILKIDELDGSMRQFYEELKTYIMKQGDEYQNYQFTQREIRQVLNISKTQIYRYITDLLNLEYITQTGGYINRGFKYKITYWDDIKALRDRIKAYLNDQLAKI